MTVVSLLLATTFSLVITTSMFIDKGMPPLSRSIFSALEDIFYFWFGVLFNVALLLALFREVKYLFNRCLNGYKFQLLTCPQDGLDVIDTIGYTDLIKVWRRWFLLLIWIVAVEMIVAGGINFFVSDVSLFSWYNIYVLYGFIFTGGYFSLVLLNMRCRQVRLRRC